MKNNKAENKDKNDKPNKGINEIESSTVSDLLSHEEVAFIEYVFGVSLREIDKIEKPDYR